MNIRDRIKELRRVKAGDLAPNPLNWRTHPKQQADALRGLLAEVGFAGAVLAREQADGTLQLIDGHLRAETVGHDTEIPVLILDVTADEAAKILATYDPLGAMAGSDAEKLDELLKSVQTSSDAVRQMIEDTAEQAGSEWAGADGSDSGEDDERYTRTVEAPIYKPTGPKPPASDMFDRVKADKLVAAVEASKLPDAEKEFLRLAAMRHVVFNYEKIAEYYAHSAEPVKEFFEDSALVIIDFKKAIELGYVKLSERLAELYGEEYPDE